MSITAFSTTASENGGRLVSGNMNENQSPSSLNDGVRSAMAMLRSWANDLEWYEYGTGSNTTSYTRVSATSISMPVDAVSIFHVSRRVKIKDGTGTTIYGRVTSSTYSSPNTTLVFQFDSGSLGSGNPISVKHGIVSATNTSLPNVVPTGTILLSGGATADSGYLFCDGTAYSRVTYSALFTRIGTAYGVGDGSSTFNLPNLQSKFPMGKASGDNLGDTGGSITQTPTGTNSAPTFTGTAFTPSGSVSLSGTVAGHSITQAQLPNITLQSTGLAKQEVSPANRGSSSGGGATYTNLSVPLGGSNQAHSHGWSGSSSFSGASVTPSGSINTPTFTGGAMDIKNPYIALNYQIKF